MLTIGLTGGIGSGKSTVCAVFEQLNVPVIDADCIAHELVQAGQPAWAAIIDRFGAEIQQSSGQLDRVRLKSIIFQSKSDKQALEAILHPRVYQCIDAQLEQLSTAYAIICVPLLIETGQAKRFDRVLLVDCPVELQYTRVQQRDRLSHAEITRIIQAQSQRSDKQRLSDDRIDNSENPLTPLPQQVENLHHFYQALACKTKSKTL